MIEPADLSTKDLRGMLHESENKLDELKSQGAYDMVIAGRHSIVIGMCKEELDKRAKG